jgi:hypothetical protein
MLVALGLEPQNQAEDVPYRRYDANDLFRAIPACLADPCANQRNLLRPDFSSVRRSGPDVMDQVSSRVAVRPDCLATSSIHLDRCTVADYFRRTHKYSTPPLSQSDHC